MHRNERFEGSVSAKQRERCRAFSVFLMLTACCVLGGISGCQSRADVKGAQSLDAEGGYTGRIRLTRFLDEPDGYCLDVPGPAHAVMLQFPLVAHTCHMDALKDQVFDFNKGGQGLLRWTTEEHDLCFTADAAEALSRINLRPCDQPALQSFTGTAVGEIKLSDTELCIHVERTGPVMLVPPTEGQDAFGRGRPVNPQFSHLMRRLELRACGDGDPSLSRWQALQN